MFNFFFNNKFMNIIFGKKMDFSNYMGVMFKNILFLSFSIPLLFFYFSMRILNMILFFLWNIALYFILGLLKQFSFFLKEIQLSHKFAEISFAFHQFSPRPKWMLASIAVLTRVVFQWISTRKMFLSQLIECLPRYRYMCSFTLPQSW